MDICEGKAKQTNESRKLCDELTKQQVPKTWAQYKFRYNIFKILLFNPVLFSPHFSVTQWILEFASRVSQLSRIKAGDMEHHQIWLGGLFQPEAWITATHQAAARKYNMSLEDLELELQFGNAADGFKVKGNDTYCC